MLVAMVMIWMPLVKAVNGGDCHGSDGRSGVFRDVLLEVKTLHYGRSTYPTSEERCHGVGRRASAIPSEYLRKARGLDQRWLGAGAEEQGPVELKFGRKENDGDAKRLFKMGC